MTTTTRNRQKKGGDARGPETHAASSRSKSVAKSSAVSQIVEPCWLYIKVLLYYIILHHIITLHRLGREPDRRAVLVVHHSIVIVYSIPFHSIPLQIVEPCWLERSR